MVFLLKVVSLKIGKVNVYEDDEDKNRFIYKSHFEFKEWGG